MVEKNATAAAASTSTWNPRVRFAPATYAGKADKDGKIARYNAATAVLLGCLGEKLELGGFVLARNADGTISVYQPKTAPITSAPDAVAPARMKAPDGFETDAADGTLPVPGGRAALDALHQAMRDAWSKCATGGSPRWGIEYPIAF